MNLDGFDPIVRERYQAFLVKKDGKVTQAGIDAEPYALMFCEAVLRSMAEDKDQNDTIIGNVLVPHPILVASR